MVSVACVIWMLFVVTVSSSSLNSRVSCLPFLDALSSSLSLWQPDEGRMRRSTRDFDIGRFVTLQCVYILYVCVLGYVVDNPRYNGLKHKTGRPRTNKRVQQSVCMWTSSVCSFT